MSAEDGLKKVISHAKEYGFVFPSSEIYDGLSAAYDYGQGQVDPSLTEERIRSCVCFNININPFDFIVIRIMFVGAIMSIAPQY